MAITNDFLYMGVSSFLAPGVKQTIISTSTIAGVFSSLFYPYPMNLIGSALVVTGGTLGFLEVGEASKQAGELNKIKKDATQISGKQKKNIEELNTVTTAVEAQLKTLEDLKQQKRDLEQALSTLENLQEKDVTSLATIHKNVSTLNTAIIEQLEKKIDELNKEITSLNERISTLDQQIKEEQAKAEKFGASLQKISAKIKELQEENLTLKQKKESGDAPSLQRKVVAMGASSNSQKK
jgi:DNA repair exonuclease SbcCD ATPase subunit